MNQTATDLSLETKKPCVPVFSGTGITTRLNEQLGQHALFFDGKCLDPAGIMRALSTYDNREVAVVVILGDPEGNSEHDRIIDGVAKRPVPVVRSFDPDEILAQVRTFLKLDPPA